MHETKSFDQGNFEKQIVIVQVDLQHEMYVPRFLWTRTMEL
jgi:hypothetical protein